MSCTVFAENMGLFHKGSGGMGTAPGDVCMTPPPPPAGPVPVPYVNIAQASDLSDGTTTVKIQGEMTAIESQSSVSTSSGNEPGSQPPKGVVTATNKGKAGFKLWSFTVKAEGKGVCRHGDIMMHNTQSDPPNIINAGAIVDILAQLAKYGFDKFSTKPCPPDREKAPGTGTNDAQKDAVSGDTKKCWSCGRTPNSGEYLSGTKYNRGNRYIADHQPPQSVVWELLGGCHPENEEKFKKWKYDTGSVMSQCNGCSSSQGAWLRNNSAKSLLQGAGIT